MKKKKPILIGLMLLLVAIPRLHAQLSETHAFNGVNLAVPDGNAVGAASFQNVASAIVSLSTIEVTVEVEGEFNGDLYGYIAHSSGFTVLLNRPGKSNANPAGYPDAGLNVTFMQGAMNGDIHTYQGVSIPTAGSPLTGTWEPDGRLADPALVLDTDSRTPAFDNFVGLDASGEWVLYLADLESGGSHTLKSWSITITGLGRPVITWVDPDPITYGTPLSITQLNASADVTGTFSYSPGLGAVLNAGLGQILSVTFTPDVPATYESVIATVNIDVLPKDLTITADNKSKVYGGTLPTLTASYDGFVNGDDELDLDTPVLLTTTALDTSPVDSYDIIASGATAANYSITHINGTLEVTPAPLTIAADPKTKVYGDGPPILTATYTGLTNGDTEGSLMTPVILMTAADASSPVGTYPITASGAADPNYTITHEDALLTVTPALLTITADDKTKLFGEAFPAFTASYDGFVNGETESVLDAAVSLNTDALIDSDIGTYTITPSLAADANYTVAFVNGTLTILPAATAGTVSSSANPSLPGQEVTFTFNATAVAPGAGVPTGAVQFLIDGLPSGGTVTLVDGSASIATSALTVGLHTVTAEYGDNGNFTGTTSALSPDQLVNTPPVAAEDIIERYPTNGVKISLTAMLSNDTDADGDTVSIDTVSLLSANGGTVEVIGNWVFYTPVEGFMGADSFTYTVVDGRGEPVTGTVTINIRVDAGPSENLTIDDLGDGSFRIRFRGIPGRNYSIQFTDSLEPADWMHLDSNTADPTGEYEYIDTPPMGSPSRYYRSVTP